MESSPMMLNLMRMSRETVDGNKQLVLKLSNIIPTGIIEIRASTIRWMLNVILLSNSSVETRDLSIQILDSFLTQLDFQSRCEPLSPTDAQIISLAAASAVILATKIHEIRPLCTSNFPHFHKDQLVDFERRLLLKIGFHIIPQATPSAFVRFMLKLWPATAGPISHTDVLMMADLLIGLFWSDPECLCYSSSTIAISALLLTFSKLHLNCREWLHCLPDECLPPKTVWGSSSPLPGPHPIFEADEISYLNIDLCILALQRVQIPCNRRVSYTSYSSPTPTKHNNCPLIASDCSRTAVDCIVLNSLYKVRMTPTSTADFDA